MPKNSHSDNPGRPFVVIESPLKGDWDKNIEFAENICRYAALHNYNPFASHLFYTRFLDDARPEDRRLGIKLGFQIGNFANEIWFCTLVDNPSELGDDPEPEYTSGMKLALSNYIKNNDKVIKEMFFGLNGMLHFERKLWPREE